VPARTVGEGGRTAAGYRDASAEADAGPTLSAQVWRAGDIEKVMAPLTIAPLPVADYAGWRLTSPEGDLGLVERLQLDPATGEPTYLAVRAGRIIVLLVPVQEVEAVDPGRQLIVLGPNASRLVPELRGDELVLLPRQELTPLAVPV
jgi:hypothetical protein